MRKKFLKEILPFNLQFFAEPYSEKESEDEKES